MTPTSNLKYFHLVIYYTQSLCNIETQFAFVSCPKLILKRRSILYVVNLILPSCFLVILDVFSFLLPPQSAERSAFKMTLILGYTVFLLLMSDTLPITGNEIPLLSELCLYVQVMFVLRFDQIVNDKKILTPPHLLLLADVFFSLSFALMVASLLESLFIVHIHCHSSQFSVPPRWLSVLMLKYISHVVFFPAWKNNNRIRVSLPERNKGIIIKLF